MEKESDNYEMIVKNLEDQFDKLEFVEFDPKIYFDDQIEDDYKILVNWNIPAALEQDATGWSAVTKWDMEEYRQMLKKQLPIGTGICYVLSIS